jgi:hypothetical protein
MLSTTRPTIVCFLIPTLLLMLESRKFTRPFPLTASASPSRPPAGALVMPRAGCQAADLGQPLCDAPTLGARQ